MNHFKFKQLELLSGSPYCYSINTIKEVIIPKLEAISRADKDVDMSLPIKSLLLDEITSLEKCVSILSEYSKKERKIKNRLVDEICEDFIFDNEKSIFIYDDRLKESEGVPLVDRLYFLYNVPTFVFVEDYKDRNVKRCLAKSHSSFPLNLMYSKHKDKFESFFGYATHATFTVKKDSLNSFVEMVREETLKANVIPKETTLIAKKYLEGDVKGSAELQIKYHDLISALFCEVNPIPVKAAMHALGFGENYLRMPLTPMDEGKEKIMLDIMRKEGIIR